MPEQEEEPVLEQEDVPEKQPKGPVYLTERQKVEMYKRWETGNFTQSELARWFGCSQQLISKIIKHLDELDTEEQEALADAYDMATTEDGLAVVNAWVLDVMSKIPRKPENVPLVAKLHKILHDNRKQLTVFPKDLAQDSTPINFGAAVEMGMLVPEEHRKRYFELMRGLTQPSGKPKSDLGRNGSEGSE